MRSSDLKWTETKLLEFSEKVLPIWELQDRQALVDQLGTSGCCGLLFSVSEKCKHLRKIPKNFHTKIENEIIICKDKSDAWEAFAKFDNRVFEQFQEDEEGAERKE